MGEDRVDQGPKAVGGQVDEQVVEVVVGQAADVGGKLPGAGAHDSSPPAPAGAAAGAGSGRRPGRAAGPAPTWGCRWCRRASRPAARPAGPTHRWCWGACRAWRRPRPPCRRSGRALLAGCLVGSWCAVTSRAPPWPGWRRAGGSPGWGGGGGHRGCAGRAGDVLGRAGDRLGGEVEVVGDVAGVQEGFGVRRRPGTLVEHRGLTSMLVPGGAAIEPSGAVPTSRAVRRSRRRPSWLGFSRPARLPVSGSWLLQQISEADPFRLDCSRGSEAHYQLVKHRQPWSTPAAMDDGYPPFMLECSSRRRRLRREPWTKQPGRRSASGSKTFARAPASKSVRWPTEPASRALAPGDPERRPWGSRRLAPPHPKTDSLVRLARALDVPPETMLARAGRGASPGIAEAGAQADDADAAERIRELEERVAQQERELAELRQLLQRQARHLTLADRVSCVG